MKFEKYKVKVGDKVKVTYRQSGMFGQIGVVTSIPNEELFEKRWIIRYDEKDFTFGQRGSFVVVWRA